MEQSMISMISMPNFSSSDVFSSTNLYQSLPWLKKIIWVIGVPRRTVVCDWRFHNLCGGWLSKHQSQTTVLLRTPITQMIFFNQGMLLLGSNHFHIKISIYPTLQYNNQNQKTALHDCCMSKNTNYWTENREGSSGESTLLPPMWPGFDFQTRRHMWVEFVGSLLCSERFSPGYSGFPRVLQFSSGYSGFPLSSKTCIWFNLICINFNLQCLQLVCFKQTWHLNKVPFLLDRVALQSETKVRPIAWPPRLSGITVTSENRRQIHLFSP